MFKSVALILTALLVLVQPVPGIPHKSQHRQVTTECVSPLRLTVKINEGGHLITVNLIESSHEFLLSSERNSSKGGNLASCFYQGSVEFEEGLATAMQRDGLISGNFYYAKQAYEIPEQPAPDSGRPNAQSLLTARLMQLSSEQLLCGVNSISAKNEAERIQIDLMGIHNQTAAKLNSKRKRRNVKLDTNPESADMPRRYIRMILIGDKSFYENQGKDENEAKRRLWEIGNIVNAHYKQLAINVITVFTDIWKSDTLFYTTSGAVDIYKLLDSFRIHRMQHFSSMPRHSVAHLITGLSIPKPTVGLAYTGQLCSFASGVGVNAYTNEDPHSGALTVAHELGHNLGLNHDEDHCRCPNERGGDCIMKASFLPGHFPDRFSSCSVSKFLDLASKGVGYCMDDVPEDSEFVATGPSCGNRIVESDEECDCGMETKCNNKCCNPKTCKFTPGSLCASGECCDLNSCTIKNKGTLCRPSKGSCDLPESCDGISEWCPRFDDYKADGTVCNPGKAHCYKGICGDRDTRCRAMLKSTDVKVADESLIPDNYFYCSYETNSTGHYSYTDCAPENKRCGLLFCIGPKEYDNLTDNYKWTGFINTYHNLKAFGDTGTIHLYGMQSDMRYSGYRDSGLVPNGASCKRNMMCVDSECKPLNPSFPCPDCNGHGVCARSGLCFCDAGYAPPDCLKAGLGGSLDNQPSTTSPKPSTTSPKPSTTSPKPSTTSPKPSTTSPKPSTTSPKPSTTSPKPSTTSPKPSTTSPNPGTQKKGRENSSSTNQLPPTKSAVLSAPLRVFLWCLLIVIIAFYYFI